MLNKKKSFLLLVFLHFSAVAQIRDYRTTRMISTSGAGVGSVLMIESVSLNPASAAFFKDPLLYVQNNSGKIENKSTDRPSDDQYNFDPKGFMLAVTDTKTRTPGGFSYQKYEENDIERERYSLNIAAPMGADSSMGVTYHYTIDKHFQEGKKKTHRADLGYFKIFSEDLTIGMALKDVTSGITRLETTGTIGAQYSLFSNLAIAIDIGQNYKRSLSDTFFYNASVQLKFFKDLSFRAGIKDDKNQNLKGGSYGVSWYGPRLALEIAQSNLRPRDDVSSLLYANEKIKEISFSMTLKI